VKDINFHEPYILAGPSLSHVQEYINKEIILKLIKLEEMRVNGKQDQRNKDKLKLGEPEEEPDYDLDSAARKKHRQEENQVKN
jgi:hypothetical protein